MGPLQTYTWSIFAHYDRSWTHTRVPFIIKNIFENNILFIFNTFQRFQWFNHRTNWVIFKFILLSYDKGFILRIQPFCLQNQSSKNIIETDVIWILLITMTMIFIILSNGWIWYLKGLIWSLKGWVWSKNFIVHYDLYFVWIIMKKFFINQIFVYIAKSKILKNNCSNLYG